MKTTPKSRVPKPRPAAGICLGGLFGLGTLICGLLLLALALLGPGRAAAAGPTVLRLDLDTIVHPLTAEYLEQGIDSAAQRHDAAVLIRLSTPGGLESSMREIIAKIISSPVPVIAWVGPSGSRAASAGFLILISADVAAMAPGTNTGAAHPVLATGGTMDPVMKQKVEQDAAAYIRSIAGKRGRNVSLAEQAVLQSKSFTETEALNNHLIDLIADSPSDLLQKIDGRTITRFDGKQETLHLAGAQLFEYSTSERYRLLRRLIDPNIAFILLVLGVLGLYVEFTHPGFIFPGVAGGILIVLALFSLSVLPINWVGALLIILAFAFFVLEAKFMSHGVLTAGGIASMVLGAVILINTPSPELRIHLSTALSVAIPFGLITAFLLRLAVRAWRSKVVTGEAGLLDEIGTAQTDLSPEGKVFVHGELWNAIADTPLPAGARVRVTRIDGLRLHVVPADPQAPPQVSSPVPQTTRT